MAKWRATQSFSLKRRARYRFVEDKHDVERVSSILENPFCEKLRVEIGVQTIVARGHVVYGEVLDGV